jgi:hypothetical protein
MTLDPILGRSADGDVERAHQLQQYVNDVDQCSSNSIDPCTFVTCGAGGICRTVTVEDDLGITREVAACGCVPGATARTTFAPDGTATVICQDQRMTFLNPGDNEAGFEALPDPCATFECGQFGTCVPINMTPTCVCQRGYVAVGNFDSEGVRQTSCVQPLQAIPDSFYEQRLPELPAEMPGGRDVDVPPPGPGAAGGSSTSANSTSANSTSGEPGSCGSNAASGSQGTGGASASGGPVAGANGSKKKGGCALSPGADGLLSWWLLVPLAMVAARRRRGARNAQSRA